MGKKEFCLSGLPTKLSKYSVMIRKRGFSGEKARFALRYKNALHHFYLPTVYGAIEKVISHFVRQVSKEARCYVRIVAVESPLRERVVGSEIKASFPERELFQFFTEEQPHL